MAKAYIPDAGDIVWLNFTPQAGVGMGYLLDERTYLTAGARWHHVSNAFRKGDDQNPGSDGAMVYLGLMISF